VETLLKVISTLTELDIYKNGGFTADDALLLFRRRFVEPLAHIVIEKSLRCKAV
jgi:hypothetical protein